MAIENDNRLTEAVLPLSLVDEAMRATILATLHPAMIVAVDGTSPLWTSHAAARLLGFKDAPSLLRGRLAENAPGTRRLAVLGQNATMGAAPHLERLRFFAGFGGAVLTAFCQKIALRSGGEALLVAFLTPQSTRAAENAAAELPLETLAVPSSEAQDNVAPPQRSDATVGVPDPDCLVPDTLVANGPAPDWLTQSPETRRPTRFIFALDHRGIVLRVTPPLADAVGVDNAQIEGRSLVDVVRAFDVAAAARIDAALAREATWSNIAVAWPVAHARMVIPVELSALPMLEAGQGLTGYSGFGRCRIDAAMPVAPGGAPEAMTRLDSESQTETPSDDGAECVQTEHSVAHEGQILEGEVLESEPLQARHGVQANLLGEDIAESSALVALDDAPAAGIALSERSMETPEIPEIPEIHDVSATFRRAYAADETEQSEAVGADDVAPEVVDFDIPPAPVEPPGRSDMPANVVSLRAGQPIPPPVIESNGLPRNGLSLAERHAFREIAKALGARFDEEDRGAEAASPAALIPAPPSLDAAPRGTEQDNGDAPHERQSVPEHAASAAHRGEGEHETRDAANDRGAPDARFLDQLPMAILILRGDEMLFANRTLLDLTGYADLDTFRDENGAHAIFRKGARPRNAQNGFDTVVLAARDGEMMPVEAHLQSIDWNGERASLISMRRAVELEQGKALRSVAVDLKRVREEAAELRGILDTATDGVITLDDAGLVLSLNGAAEALFGMKQNEIVGESFTHLFANESHAAALDYLDGLRANGVRSVLNDGREIVGRERKGGRIPLFMTIGRINEDEPKRFCAVLRDLTAWKRAEAQLTDARRTAELASAKKSDFLAKISHEIRTPMNAIIGFAELMMEERLGPVGTPRYKEYLADIRTSGQHVVSLVNDLLDLAKIEAGRMELSFVAVDLNALLASCVGIMQPQANANRVLVRAQLAQKLPNVVADERSMRQIILNMLSNATRFTEAGGQVIVSTALLESGEAVLRIRDTGIGMNPVEIEQALEPFRQVGVQRGKGGTGLGLPLTKALVDANRANFSIRSTPGEGTLVEITFPSTRVLAE